MLNFCTDESEDESDSAFEKFVEQFRTPLSKFVSYTNESEDTSDSEFEKSVEQYRTPLIKPVSYRNESEDASDPEFEKFVDQYRTPLTKPLSYRNESEDASDSEFEKFVEQYRTPLTKPLGKYQSGTPESEDDETEFRKFTERVTEKIHSRGVILHFVQDSVSSPSFPEKQKLTYSSKGDSEDDCVSANVEESTQNTLQSQIVPSHNNTEHISSDSGEHHNEKDTSSGMHSVSSVITSSDSEDEESEFLKFSERIRQTPRIQNIVHVPKSVTNDPLDDKDDDEVFLKLSESFRKPYTPKSQNRNNARHSIVSSSFPGKQGSFHSSNEGSSDLISSGDKPAQNSLEVLQTRNKEEFTALFPTASQTLETFCRKRQKYAEQLFDFFNKKIFDSQLPKDIPVIWDNSLAKAAGLTCCSRKNGVYSCCIKLSSKLLTSFERLQDTMLHEMCHAAVWIINKIESVNHGPLWQIWGSRCKMILPFIECPERCHTYDVPYSIWYQCLTCNWKKGRFRQSQSLANSVCKKCRKPVIVTRA